MFEDKTRRAKDILEDSLLLKLAYVLTIEKTAPDFNFFNKFLYFKQVMQWIQAGTHKSS